MKRVQKIGTVCICTFMCVGFLMVMTTFLCYFYQMKTSKTNPVIEWFNQNSFVNFNWIVYLRDDVDISPSDRYVYLVDGMESTIEKFCTGNLPCDDVLVAPANFYKTSLLRNELGTGSNGSTNAEVVKKAVGYVEKLNASLEKQGIPLVYMQLPTSDRIRAAHGENEYNKNYLLLGDELAVQMAETDIDFINLDDEAELIDSAELDASRHWYTKDALAATEILATYLNDNYDYSFDLSLFDYTNYEDVFASVDGCKEAILAENGYEIELLVPKAEYNYTVKYGYDTEEPKGNFTDTLVNKPEDWKLSEAYHNAFRLQNGFTEHIVNAGDVNNTGKKILILGDSFSWPISAYISQDVSEVYAFHPQYGGAVVSDVIKKFKPDIVIVAYIESQVGLLVDENFGFMVR